MRERGSECAGDHGRLSEISEAEAAKVADAAIRAKAIEECINAKIILPAGQLATASDDFLHGFQAGAEAQIDSIRALKSQDKIQTETE